MVAIAAFSLVVEFPARHQSVIFLLTNVIVSVALVAAGVLVKQTLREQKLATALMLGGALWASQWLSTWNTSILPVIGAESNAFFYVVTAWGILRYPQDLALTRSERFYVRALWFMPVTDVFMFAASRPQWEGFSSHVIWPSIVPNHALRNSEFSVSYFVILLLAIAFIVLLKARIRRMKGIDQLISRPLAYGFCVVAIASGVSETTQFYPNTQVNSYFFHVGLATLAVPLGLLLVLLKQRLQHAHVADTLHNEFAREGTTIATVESSLRLALNDPSLEVFYWSNETDAYVSKHAQPFAEPPANSIVRSVETRNGNKLALLVGNASLEHHPAILLTAITVSTMALENARLQAEVLSQLEEVRASRTRIAEAGIAERRRIERDLHDGVQQRLLALATRIGTAERNSEPEANSNLEWIREDIIATLGDVRDLARGILPTELRQFGLKAAIATAAEGLPIAVEINANDERFPDSVEATAYFVTCEALTNAVKHSEATSLKVDVQRQNNFLHLTVCDNGVGGAEFDARGGLRGLSDRVNALRGKLFINSALGNGTTIKVEIPCA